MGYYRGVRRLHDSGVKLLKRACSNRDVREAEERFQRLMESDSDNLHVFALEEAEPDQNVNVSPMSNFLSSLETDMKRYIENDWRISYDNPERIIAGFSTLHVKSTFKLEAY